MSFLYSNTPADNLSGAIRTEFVNNLSAAWEVGAIVSYDPGAIAARQHAAFILNHLATNNQILVVVGDGSGAQHQYAVESTQLGGAGSTSNNNCIFMAADFTGSKGVGSGSFWDMLYGSAIDPTNLSFWGQDQRSRAYRLLSWFDEGGAADLWVIENSDPSVFELVAYTANATSKFSAWGVSDRGIDRSTSNLGTAEPTLLDLVWCFGTATDAAPNTLNIFIAETWKDVTEVGGPTVIERATRTTLYNATNGYTLGFAPPSHAAEIGVNNTRQTQAIMAFHGEPGSEIAGTYHPDLMRGYPIDDADYFGKKIGGDFIQINDRMLGVFDSSLADPIP